MKKLLGSTLALAMFLPAGASAELLKNFKVSGSLEVDAVSANNITDFRTDKYDNIGTAQTRLLLNADWDLLDDVHARVTLNKNNRTYGTGSENLNTVQSNLLVDQSYVKIDKLFGGLDTTLGRQFYGEAGDLVIYYGPKNTYGLQVTSIDGARFDWNGEKVGVTALVAKQTGGALGAADTANVNLNGLDLHVKAMEHISGAAYVYERTIVNNGVPTGTGVIANDILWVAGLKATLTAGGAWLKGEFAKNFGQMRSVAAGGYTFTGNYTGWAAKLNGGLKVDLGSLGALTGWGEGGIGSGGNATNSPNRAFAAIAGDYRPGGIYGRFAPGTAAPMGNITGTLATNTLSNRAIFGAGLKVTPAVLTKLTAGFSWWNYRVQDTASLPAAAKGNKFLGNEYDLDLTWAHSENVSVSAGVGTFQPGRAIIVSQATGAVNPATLAYTDFSIKF